MMCLLYSVKSTVTKNYSKVVYMCKIIISKDLGLRPANYSSIKESWVRPGKRDPLSIDEDWIEESEYRANTGE